MYENGDTVQRHGWNDSAACYEDKGGAAGYRFSPEQDCLLFVRAAQLIALI